MYIYDSAWGADNATSSCVERNPGTHGDIMIDILDCLTAVNTYIPLYQQAHDILRRENAATKVHLQLALPQGVDPRRYNLPSSNEIAAILPGDNEHADVGRDLIVTLHLQNQQDAPRFQRIFETNFNYTPLMYVLLFPMESQAGVLESIFTTLEDLIMIMMLMRARNLVRHCLNT